MEIHYIIHSYGLIPEVELFLDKESAKEYWLDAFGDLAHDYDEKTPEESFDCGFAHWHDVEMRHRIEKLEIDPFIQVLFQKMRDLVKNNPNDQILGKKVREHYKGGFESGK